MIKFAKCILSENSKYAAMYNEEENWCICVGCRNGHHAIEYYDNCFDFAKEGNNGNIEATSEEFLEVYQMAHTALRLKIIEGTKRENEFIKNEGLKQEGY